MTTIAVIGSGAVGSYYGARLAQAGHDVAFVMRRDLAAVKESGLRVQSVDGDFHLAAVRAVASAAEIGPVDWLICSLKSTALASAHDLLAPCVGDRTRILALMNGLGVEDAIAGWFGAGRVFGGMAFVCINRGVPGVVHHLRYGILSVGHFLDDPAECEHLATLLRPALIAVVVAADLRRARWEKLAWNVPFNGLSAAGGGISTEAIVQDAALRAVAERAMRELIAAADADLASRGAQPLEGEALVERMFALTDTMGPYATSMALDYLNGQELEVEAILGEPMRRAAALAVPVPTIDAIYALVRAADRRRRGLVSPVAPPGP